MMSLAQEFSPTIFDRMLGVSYTPGVPKAPREPKPKTDETHRFYLCQKEEGAKWSYTCQRGTLEEVCAEQVRRQRLEPGHGLFTGIHVKDVAAGCPAWNDALVLAQKLGRPVALRGQISAAANSTAK